MGKRKSRSRTRSLTITQVDNEPVEVAPGNTDLRKVPPVARMRGLQAVMREKLARDQEKLQSWQKFTDNQAAIDASLTLGGILNDFATLDGELEELEKAGFSPARKSYTASANEGDKVTVLEDKRGVYADLMDPATMIDMLVIKKRPGKGGGLIVESKDGTRMQVSVSHVVRLSKAA